MRVLVFGKSGQLAVSLARLGVNRTDMDVVCVGRPDTDLLREGDVEKAVQASRADIVINAAAYTAVDKAESEEDLVFRINASAAGDIAAAAFRHGLPVIHVSTDYVFDGLSRRPYREDDPVAPQGAYGRSKLAGERAVAAANPHHVIARTAWVYSADGTNFVKTMLRLGKERQELGIVSDQIGNPTAADDLATALLDIARVFLGNPDRAALSGPVHVAGTGIASWYDLAAHVFRCAARHGYQPPRLKALLSEDYPTPARRPQNSRLDATRLAQVFGLELPLWTDSVERIVGQILTGDTP